MLKFIAIVITVVITVTPALARHGHHRPSGHHHRQARGVHSHRGSPAHDTQPLETRDGPSAPVPKHSSPPVELSFDPAPDSQPGLWRISSDPNRFAGHRPKVLHGRLVINGVTFPVVSGGNGWSIPYGHWPVTPEDVGPWGARHKAIGLNHGDDIPDPEIKRGRDGVEIHAANHDATGGCVGVLSRFDELREKVFEMLKASGQAWLHVLPHAFAITPTPVYDPPPDYSLAEDDSAEESAHGNRPHHHADRRRNANRHRYVRHHHLHYASGD